MLLSRKSDNVRNFHRPATVSVSKRLHSSSVQKRVSIQSSLARINLHLHDDTHTPRIFSTLTSLLRECGSLKALLEGHLVHGHIIRCSLERDTYMGNLLIDMYGKFGLLREAQVMFDKMPARNIYSWNILISGYTRHECGEAVLHLFKVLLKERMQPDKYTFAGALVASSLIESLLDGKCIHACIIDGGLESDVYIVSALVNMYGKCGSLDDAHCMFDKLLHKDVVTWNALITAYVLHGQEREALQLYEKMHQYGVKHVKVTFLSALGACAGLVNWALGKLVHASIVEQGLSPDISISTALVSMYSSCGSLGDAQSTFKTMARHDLVSWSAMISVNTQHGEDEDALFLFSKMHMEGYTPDRVSYVSILSACANLAALTKGRLIHSTAVDYGLDSDIAIGNALINMYGKCGNLVDTKRLFDRMSMRNVISWSAMIEVQAYAGHATIVLQLFLKMQDQGIMPNYVTFVNILSACSHAGFIDEACHLLCSMVHEYEITITMGHYSTMIDLFGRAGRLVEAEFIIPRMSIEPNAIIWETLLSSCRVHGDLDRGKRAAEHAILLNSMVASPYILLSNIYSAEGRWEDAAKIWKLMFEKGLTSTIDIGCNLTSDDNIHEEHHIWG